MEPQDGQRRLTVILAADMVGYSRLMEVDERGTVAQIKAHRKEFIDPKIAQYRGHVLKRTGDGALVEFGSVVDAVLCAVEIQRGMARRCEGVPADLRIEFRVGIDFGDVVFEDDDFHGTGVIKAARLEGLAEAGGIYVSRSVYDRAKASVDVGFEALGERRLKNLEEPVEVFRVLTDGQTGTAAAPWRGEHGKALWRPWRWPLAAALALLIAFAGGLSVWNGWMSAPPVETDHADIAAAQRAALQLPDKPSIAVLPFVNLSDDAGQEYFVDGLTEDLITDLAKVSGLFVISRNSVFTYKGQAVSAPQVAQELGVRFVLEGSVRRSDDTIRVTAQLVDAQSDGHLWAERYDRVLDEVFAVQDEIKQRIVTALAVELTGGELAKLSIKPTENIEAYEYYLRGRQAMHNLEMNSIGLAYWALEKAIELDPDFAEALAALGMTYAIDYRGTGSRSIWWRPPARARARAIQLAGQASELDPDLALPDLVLAHISLTDREFDQALVHVDRAIVREPGNSVVQETQGLILTAAGQHEDALLAMDKALRLDPRPRPLYYNTLGRIQFALHDYVNAVENLEKSAEQLDTTENWWYNIYLYASYAYLGDTERFALVLERDISIISQISLSEVRMTGFYRRNEDMNHFLEGLRRAGSTEYPYGFQPEQHLDQKISGDRVRDLLFGHTFQALHEGRPSLPTQFSFSADGLATWQMRHDISDTGRARIEGDGVCIRFPVITRGREVCYQVFANQNEDQHVAEFDYVLVGPRLYYFSSSIQ